MDLQILAAEKIKYGESLIDNLSKFSSIEGIQKLHRKIKQELNFLKKICKSDTIKKEHLQCSNLTHFGALIQTLNNVNDCISVCKPFYLDDRKLVVDIVCDKGLTWLKVVARNPKSLSQVSMGDASFGVRSVVDQAQEFVDCAKFYPNTFQTPTVIFVFTNGIERKLSQVLESIGVVVKGQLLKNAETDNVTIESNRSLASDLSSKCTSNISKVNLDVSAMLAYVSSVTNGSCDKYEFSVPVLSQQAKWECERPQKPILVEFFKGKRLYCCETAKNSFEEIVKTVGGSTEKTRAQKLLEQVIVLPDDATAHDTIEGSSDNEIFSNVQYSPDKILPIGGKIRERSLVVFTFGDRIQAVTVTANDGFVRAAKQQGINFVVFVHESRALTEQKEQTRAVRVLQE